MAGIRKALPFLRQHTGDVHADRAQQSGQQAAQVSRLIPWLVGVLLDGGKGDGTGPGVTVNGTATTINHGLGRKPRGFIVVDMMSNATSLKRSATQPADQTKQINLEAAAIGGTLVKLWIW